MARDSKSICRSNQVNFGAEKRFSMFTRRFRPLKWKVSTSRNYAKFSRTGQKTHLDGDVFDSL